MDVRRKFNSMDELLNELEENYPEITNFTMGPETRYLITKNIQKPVIYTDGSCLTNPGPGGWCGCILYPDEDREWIIVGGEEETTNNRMELTAVIEALGFVGKECIIYTDSQWTLKCSKGEWKRKVNLDLWKKFDEVSKDKIIEWNWVKAHNGDEYNELVDKLAREEAKNMKNLKCCK